MEMLSNGSRGDAVTALQRKLFAIGFNPGTIDGIFGPATDQAVRGYQEKKGLQVDGIAGPETFTSLGMMEAEKPAAVEAVRRPELTKDDVAPQAADVAPQAAPVEHKAPEPSVADGLRAAQRQAADETDAEAAAEMKAVENAPKGIRAKIAALREARRNRGR
jgi:peptidoglycan hydrolase-like protein with peptidoglycan-binding domain